MWVKSKNAACPQIFCLWAENMSKAPHKILHVLYQQGNRQYKACSTDGRPISTYLWKGQLKEGQTKWQILWFKWVFCSFVWFCYMAGRNTWSSLSEHKSVNTQDTISSIQSKVRVEAMSFRMTRRKHLSVTRQARGKQKKLYSWMELSTPQ